jgi:uncharacterized protein YkwD
MDYSVEEEIIEDILNKIRYFVLPSKDNNYRSKFLQSNILLYCVVLLLTLKIIATLVSINIPPNIFFADITKSALENFANQTRQSMGMPVLKENQKLNQAAQLKAENMVANNYFAHTSPQGITPWFWFIKAGYNYKYAGENLAIGFYDSKEVYNAWLNSPAHKANIVNPNYAEVGTAILSGFGENNAIVVVQEFGTQLSAKTAEVKNNNPKPTTPLPQVSVENQKPSTEIVVQETTINNEITPNTNKEVLSQSIEYKSALESFKTGSSDVYYKIMNYVLYDYDVLLQKIVYGISLIVIGILLMLIFFNFDISFKSQLVFRSVLILVLLSAATLIDREIIISLIPHQIII